MAPPLAGREDRAEVRRAVKDGVLMFATDHAPHVASRKNCGYEKAANGIIGLETAVAITYQVMVEEEGMPIGDWAKAWYEMPRGILAAKNRQLRPTCITVGELYTVDLDSFASLSRNCPYQGMRFNCRPTGG
jgi:dihydroorotase